MEYAAMKNGRSRRAAALDDLLWPKGIVYYSFNKNLGKYIVYYEQIFMTFKTLN